MQQETFNSKKRAFPLFLQNIIRKLSMFLKEVVVLIVKCENMLREINHTTNKK